MYSTLNTKHWTSGRGRVETVRVPGGVAVRKKSRLERRRRGGRGRPEMMVRRSSGRGQRTLPLSLLHSTLQFCPHPSNAPWQVRDFCTAPSHRLPSHQPPSVPRFPPAATSSFPLGMGPVKFSPTPSRGRCRNKRDLSGNGGFNMALALRSLGVDCQEPGPLTHYPSPPTHFLLS